MKSIKLTAVAALLIAGEAFAASTVSDVVARQRWPWNGKVDIDFTVTGDTTNVDFMATWDGQSYPVLLGTAYDAAAGQHRFEFDPASLGLANETLTGFAVTAANSADHTYLILDLVNGGYSYLADVPAGGWTDEHKSTKMVFRRIPKGAYANGVSATGMITMFGNDAVGPATGNTRFGKPAQYMCSRTDTLSSDFYMAIFPMTIAQHSYATKSGVSTDYKVKDVTFNALRGNTAENEIYWPQTEYKVADNSLVNTFRGLSGNTLLIDLPTEQQWEAAARCGASTVFPEGGTLANSPEAFQEITNIINKIAVWIGNDETTYTSVGTKEPNRFGLYDTVGVCHEWTLSVAMWQASATSTPRLGLSSNSDYVGCTFDTTRDSSIKKSNRILKSNVAFNPEIELWKLFPSFRSLKSQESSQNIGARFCIHLKPLDFTTADKWN